MKILLIVCSCLAAFLVLALLGLYLLSKAPAVKAGYWNQTETAGTLESVYTQTGPHPVSKASFESGDEKLGQFQLWYPSSLEGPYPLVIMVNGTGVPASKYEAVLEHLATWGFLAAGNEDGESWNGVSSSETLSFVLGFNEDPASPFYQKVDTAAIGIAGHSQGGVGAVNAASNFENSHLYSSVYLASTTWIDLAKALQWPYDITRLSAPCFMTAGTGKADAETIAPLTALRESYNSIVNGFPVVMARRSNTDHGQMLANADGYMTAWFCYTLKEDPQAARVFAGEQPEIGSNPNWQDAAWKNFPAPQ